MRIATARATLGSDPRSQKTSNKKIQIGNKTLYQETQKISDTPSICRCQGMDKPVSAWGKLTNFADRKWQEEVAKPSDSTEATGAVNITELSGFSL